MKVFAGVILVLAIAFAGFKFTQTPSVASVKTVQHENMTQFSSDFAKFMGVYVEKKSKGELTADLVDISAQCKPNQGEYHTRCWITIRTSPNDPVEKATAENVRRQGNKFVWDHES
jgi:hypothetical protein